MATKPITGIYTGTNSALEQLNRRFASGRLVLNLTTGEIRKGPGQWRQMKALDVTADVPVDFEVAAVATTNVTIATALVTGQTVGGVELEAGDLVLVMGQSTANQNGVYVAGTTPARVSTLDDYAAHAGIVVKDADGLLYLCTSGVTGTLGTTAIAFERFIPGTFERTGNNQVSGAITAAALADADVMLVEQGGKIRKVTLATLKTYMNA